MTLLERNRVGDQFLIQLRLVRDQIKRLLGDDLATVGQEHSHANFPVDLHQVALIAERRGRQHTLDLVTVV